MNIIIAHKRTKPEKLARISKSAVSARSLLHMPGTEKGDVPKDKKGCSVLQPFLIVLSLRLAKPSANEDCQPPTVSPVRYTYSGKTGHLSR